MPRDQSPVCGSKHCEVEALAALVGPLPGKEPVDEVGHHQQPIGGPEDARLLLLEGEQLIERIELHELQAGRREDFLPRHRLLGDFDHAAGAGIAIADGIAEECVVGGEEREIDAPGIDADARHSRAMAVACDPQARHDLMPQPDEIPDQLAPHRHGEVFEAMNFFQFEKAAIEGTRRQPGHRRPRDRRRERRNRAMGRIVHFSAALTRAARRRKMALTLAGMTRRKPRQTGWVSINSGRQPIVERVEQHCRLSRLADEQHDDPDPPGHGRRDERGPAVGRPAGRHRGRQRLR